MKKIAYFLLSMISLWLAGCTSAPQVVHFPEIRQQVRLFKVVKLNSQQQIMSENILSVQMMPDKWRWVEVNALGAPLARVQLNAQGWHNDGFIMPNPQAVQLFSAVATALQPQQTIFLFKRIEKMPQSTKFFPKTGAWWQTQKIANGWEIQLADSSQWQITELEE